VGGPAHEACRARATLARAQCCACAVPSLRGSSRWCRRPDVCTAGSSPAWLVNCKPFNGRHVGSCWSKSECQQCCHRSSCCAFFPSYQYWHYQIAACRGRGCSSWRQCGGQCRKENENCWHAWLCCGLHGLSRSPFFESRLKDCVTIRPCSCHRLSDGLTPVSPNRWQRWPINVAWQGPVITWDRSGSGG